MLYERANHQQQQQIDPTRAQRAYPDHELMPDNSRNRQEYARAVAVVRSTSGGWLLDRQVQRN